MKGAAFLFIVLISALLLAGWRTPIASSSEGAGTLLKIQNPGNRISPPPRQLLADRTDTKDAIILGTDPEMDRAMEEQARKEQERKIKHGICCSICILIEISEEDLKLPSRTTRHKNKAVLF